MSPDTASVIQHLVSEGPLLSPEQPTQDEYDAETRWGTPDWAEWPE